MATVGVLRSIAVLAMLSLAVVLFELPSAGQVQGSAIFFEQIDPDLSRYGAVNWEQRWNRPVISVCWLNPTEFAQERAWVQDAVKHTWQDASSLRFVGWNECSSASADVKIQIDESNPRSYVGQSVLGRSPGMWLNFTFNSWSLSCKSNKEFCIRAVAVHEFGHAAGFQHEQLQSDAPSACVEHLKQTGQWENVGSPPKPLTPYDADSVMNYCNAIWNNSGKLSKNDIKAIRVLFPPG